MIHITSKTNFLVHHPDLLITATALSNAPQCRRKPLLSALVRSTLDITPSLLWGNMLHEVMQTCMAEQRWDKHFIERNTEDVIKKNLAELVKINVSIDEAKREVKARSKGLRVFSERYIAETPKVVVATNCAGLTIKMCSSRLMRSSPTPALLPIKTPFLPYPNSTMSKRTFGLRPMD